ncbi:MAG: putative creatininase [Frankiales bacterium]|nr:putative creatininase [Frankiales bacterium]
MTRAADLTWPEAAERSGWLLVVPLGSTEQHGPHLPLSTDTDIAVRLATGLADRRPQVLVAPEIAYGASGEHAGFPGTLSIGTEVLHQLLVELVRSADLTAARVLLLNGHGGNTDAVRRAVEQLTSEGRQVRSWSPGWRGDAHAGRTETSLQLAGGVRVGAERPVGAVAPLTALLPRLRAEGVRAVSPNGVLGDASGATADEGTALLASALDELVRFVEQW